MGNQEPPTPFLWNASFPYQWTVLQNTPEHFHLHPHHSLTIIGVMNKFIRWLLLPHYNYPSLSTAKTFHIAMIGLEKKRKLFGFNQKNICNDTVLLWCQKQRREWNFIYHSMHSNGQQTNRQKNTDMNIKCRCDTRYNTLLSLMVPNNFQKLWCYVVMMVMSVFVLVFRVRSRKNFHNFIEYISLCENSGHFCLCQGRHDQALGLLAKPWEKNTCESPWLVELW